MITLELLEDLFARAAITAKHLPFRDRQLLKAKTSAFDYLYDMDDRKDWEDVPIRLRPTQKDIDLLDQVGKWLNAYLGVRTDKRTVAGKRIIWARACGFSYRDVNKATGIHYKTVEFWYKNDMRILCERVKL